MRAFKIAVDFDGTIVEHSYPSIGAPAPGAIEALRKWQRDGCKVFLFTMRSGYGLKEAVDYCRDHGLVFDGVNTNPDQHEWTSSPKCFANVYIDDAAIGCPLVPGINGKPLVDWTRVIPDVEARKDAWVAENTVTGVPYASK